MAPVQAEADWGFEIAPSALMRGAFAFLGPFAREASLGGALFFARFRRALRPERFSVTASA
jgi:hypothetical protein